MSRILDTLENVTPEDLETLGIAIIDATPWFDILEERFGIDRSVFEDYVVIQPNPKQLHLASKSITAPLSPRPESIGMPFMRIVMRFPKVSTAAAMAFGTHATKNALDLTEAQLDRYLHRDLLWPDEDQLQGCTGRGYVIVRHRRFALGMALLRVPPETADDPRPFVESMFPKSWAIASHRSAFDTEL